MKTKEDRGTVPSDVSSDMAVTVTSETGSLFKTTVNSPLPSGSLVVKPASADTSTPAVSSVPVGHRGIRHIQRAVDGIGAGDLRNDRVRHVAVIHIVFRARDLNGLWLVPVQGGEDQRRGVTHSLRSHRRKTRSPLHLRSVP